MALTLTIRPTDQVVDCDGILVRVWTGYTQDRGLVTVLVATVHPQDPIAEGACRVLLREIPSPREGLEKDAREKWLASLGLDAGATSAEIVQALRLRRTERATAKEDGSFGPEGQEER